ncbi:hypothetical protein GINT2_001611 [Glugoides intestinalis]
MTITKTCRSKRIDNTEEKELELPINTKIITNNPEEIVTSVIGNPEEIVTSVIGNPEEIVTSVIGNPEEIVTSVIGNPEEILTSVIGNPEEIVTSVIGNPEEILTTVEKIHFFDANSFFTKNIFDPIKISIVQEIEDECSKIAMQFDKKISEKLLEGLDSVKTAYQVTPESANKKIHKQFIEGIKNTFETGYNALLDTTTKDTVSKLKDIRSKAQESIDLLARKKTNEFFAVLKSTDKATYMQEDPSFHIPKFQEETFLVKEEIKNLIENRIESIKEKLIDTINLKQVQLQKSLSQLLIAEKIEVVAELPQAKPLIEVPQAKPLANMKFNGTRENKLSSIINGYISGFKKIRNHTEGLILSVKEAFISLNMKLSDFISVLSGKIKSMTKFDMSKYVAPQAIADIIFKILIVLAILITIYVILTNIQHLLNIAFALLMLALCVLIVFCVINNISTPSPLNNTFMVYNNNLA